MNFTDSVKTCLTKYADFNGRGSKAEYWWYVLFVVVVSIVLSFVSSMLSGLFSLATLLPSIAAATRRLHDTDRSGWMQLIALIPLIGWLIVIYFLVQDPKEPNRFGAAPAN